VEEVSGFVCFLVSVSCLPGGLCLRECLFFFPGRFVPSGMLVFLSRAVCAFGNACFSFPGGLCLRDVIFFFFLLLASQAGDILYVRGISLGRFLSFFREVFASLVCFS
jgi:hypothetical protein